MLKIRALNQSSQESKVVDTNKKKDENEKVALSEYSQAVKFLCENKKKEALEILEELLKTQLIYNLKPVKDDESSQTLKKLKFSCFKNISYIQNTLENYDNAFHNSLEAINLDDTDVRLWCKVGDLAIKLCKTDLACMAYKQGLIKNNNYWPCLDGLISALFATPDYLNCLLYISIALERDPSYLKGCILQKKILETIPSVQLLSETYNNLRVSIESNNYNVPVTNCIFTENLKNKYIEKLSHETKKQTLIPIPSEDELTAYSWLKLGETLVQLYKYVTDHKLNFANPIEIIISNSLDVTVLTLVKDMDSNINLENAVHDFRTNGNEKKVEELQKVELSNGNANDTALENKNQLNNVSDSDLNKTECNSELDTEKNQKVKKRRRSSLSFLTQWAWSDDNIKRSSRIRTLGRKDPSKNYMMLEENLKQLFPSTLLQDNAKSNKEENMKDDSTLIKTDSNSFITSETDQTTDSDGNLKDSDIVNSPFKTHEEYFDTDNELIDVKNFVSEHSKKSNLIIMMTKFLNFLNEKWNTKWPNHLSELYIKIYLFLRNHIEYSSQIFEVTSCSSINSEPATTLLFCEMYMDKFLNTQSSSTEIQLDISTEDLGFLAFYSNNSNELSDLEYKYYVMRILWFKANFFLHQGKTELSVKILEEIHEKIKRSETFIKLVNCQYNSIINEKTVTEMLNFIKRKEKLSNIKDLYEFKKYEELCNILEEVFNFPKQVSKISIFNETPLDRVEYMKILLDSLCQIKRFEECFTWAEVSLNDSLQNYLNLIGNGENEEEKKKWIQSILYSLEKLHDSVTEVGTFVVKYLSETLRLRLLQNLVNIVCHQLDMLDNGHSMVIESISPWIIFHHIFLYEEDKQRATTLSVFKCKSYTSVQSELDEDEEEIPASIKVLIKAHEYLGHHGKCCMNNGKLLKFIMNLIVPKLHFPLYISIKQNFKLILEQAIYCLYGYPSKPNTNVKSKTKLDEHVKSHMSLTWEASQQLFEIYKPVNIPTFDAKKYESINSDAFSLFKKIIDLIPHDSDPSHLINEMNLYLTGNSKKMPSLKKPLPFQVSYIYYLIADYYFKGVANQSWSNASKYYTLDLCIHHNEFNSWVGLAMSTSTLMETWLNNFQPDITEEKYLRKAKIAQKCYSKAIEIDPTYLTIWTEFGNFLYTVHAFCARLLKQESDSLNMKRFGKLESKKEEMLGFAKKCFESAFNLYATSIGEEHQDERWLYQYMLAKIAEKKNEDPPVFLKHYLKAGKLLFQNNAQYPKKINHKNPPNLSMEALEVHYRIHTSILKYLEKNEGPLKKSLILELENILERCLRSPFIITELKPDNVVDLQKNSKTDSNTTVDKNVVSSDNFGDSQIQNLKRPNEESKVLEENKKLKLSETSHLDLMKDVVVLTDDLITKVCTEVNSDQTGLVMESKSETAHGSTSASIKSGSKKSGNEDGDSTTTSSSENSSETDDSSDSFSCRSDSTATENNGEEKRKKNINHETNCTEEEKNKLIEFCIAALEQCVLRFPEHYKSIYRLAYFFFHSKSFKSISKSQQLLLGTYQCQFHKNHTIRGLFTERKTTNFFNGIWRIPSNEIDRPGSFAYHMSRCITLLMEVSNESGDSKMLTELCMQLRKTPDSDKKYLKDDEREQLSNQALTLCEQCLRSKISKFDCQNTINTGFNNKAEQLSLIMLEIYHVYLNIKNIQEFESSHMPKIKKLLENAYVLILGNNPMISGNIFEIAVDFCRQKTRAMKVAETSGRDNGMQDLRSFTNESKLSNIVSNPMNNSRKSKSQASSVNKKHQEKLPGTKKIPPPINNYNPMTDPLLFQNSTFPTQFPLISQSASDLIDYTVKNVLQSSLNPSMIGSPINYSTHEQKLLEIWKQSLVLEQFKKNLLTQSNEVTMNSSELLNKRNQPESTITAEKMVNMAKERLDLSITPVTQPTSKKKQKVTDKISAATIQNPMMNLPMSISNSLQISPTPNFSLIKPAHTNQMKLPQNQLYPSNNNLSISQKNFPLNQPASSHRTQPSGLLPSFNSWPVASSHQETASKKRYNSPVTHSGSIEKKQKKATNSLSNTYNNHLYNNPANFRSSPESNFVKVKDINTLKAIPTSSKVIKSHQSHPKKKSDKPKSFGQQIATDSVNNIMLSQLQHHPHLEIIPQTSQPKPQKNLGKDFEFFVTPKLIDLPAETAMPVHRTSQGKSHPLPLSASHSTGNKKLKNDNVEIITLDD